MRWANARNYVCKREKRANGMWWFNRISRHQCPNANQAYHHAVQTNWIRWRNTDTNQTKLFTCFPVHFLCFCVFALIFIFHFSPIRPTHIPIAVAKHWNARSDSHFMLSQSRERWKFEGRAVHEWWRHFSQQRSSIPWDERFQYLLHLGTACYETKTTRQTRHKSLKIKKKKKIWLKQNTDEQQKKKRNSFKQEKGRRWWWWEEVEKTANRVSHQILIKEYDNFMENFWPCTARTMHPSLQTS